MNVKTKLSDCLRPLVLGALFLGTASAHAAVQQLDKVVAIFDNDVIMQSQLDQRVKEVQQTIAKRGGGVPPTSVLDQQVLERLIVENLQLQIGDRVTVVGPELSVAHAERLFGNSLKRLNHPNLIPIFIGIALGVVLGSISFWIPGVPQPVKLGLAGGPLIVAILIGRYGPHYRLITYTTMSANLMLREVGISLFLAGVGLGAGEDFVPTLVAGGYVWIAYGAVITIVPLLLAGLFGRFYYKLNYYTLIGVLSGASTNPPALAYSTEQTTSDAPSVGYATVYPLSMFLRVLAAQLLILIFG